MSEQSQEDTPRQVTLGFFPNAEQADRAVRRLADADYPLDRASVLGKAQSSGDDPLGIYYPNAGERMKGWGSMGALWGGLWGVLSGAAGMFLVPGVGPVVAAGPIVNAITGGVAGAGLAGGAMTGAAALSHVATAAHRMGVPEERLQDIHDAVDAGEVLVMLIADREDMPRWTEALEEAGATRVWTFPYHGLVSAARERQAGRAQEEEAS
jgi:hypothetical protein